MVTLFALIVNLALMVTAQDSRQCSILRQSTVCSAAGEQLLDPNTMSAQFKVYPTKFTLDALSTSVLAVVALIALVNSRHVMDFEHCTSQGTNMPLLARRVREVATVALPLAVFSALMFVMGVAANDTALCRATTALDEHVPLGAGLRVTSDGMLSPGDEARRLFQFCGQNIADPGAVEVHKLTITQTVDDDLSVSTAEMDAVRRAEELSLWMWLLWLPSVSFARQRCVNSTMAAGMMWAPESSDCLVSSVEFPARSKFGVQPVDCKAAGEMLYSLARYGANCPDGALAGDIDTYRQTGLLVTEGDVRVSEATCSPPVPELLAATNSSFLGGPPLGPDFFECSCTAFTSCARRYYGPARTRTQGGSVIVCISMVTTCLAFVIMLLKRAGAVLASRGLFRDMGDPKAQGPAARLWVWFAALLARAEAQKQRLLRQPYVSVPTSSEGTAEGKPKSRRLLERAVACWVYTETILASRIAASFACGLAVDLVLTVAVFERLVPVLWSLEHRVTQEQEENDVEGLQTVFWASRTFLTGIAALVTVWNSLHPVAYICAAIVNLHYHMRLRATFLALTPEELFGSYPVTPDVQRMRAIAAHGRIFLGKSGRYVGYAALSLFLGAQIFGLVVGLIVGLIYVLALDPVGRKEIWPIAEYFIRLIAVVAGTLAIVPMGKRCLMKTGAAAGDSPDGILMLRPCMFSWYELFYSILSLPTGILVALNRSLLSALVGLLNLLNVYAALQSPPQQHLHAIATRPPRLSAGDRPRVRRSSDLVRLRARVASLHRVARSRALCPLRGRAQRQRRPTRSG